MWICVAFLIGIALGWWLRRPETRVIEVPDPAQPAVSALAHISADLRAALAAIPTQPTVVEVEKPVLVTEREMVTPDLSPLQAELRALQDALRAVPTLPRRTATPQEQIAQAGDVNLILMDADDREVIATQRVNPIRRRRLIEYQGQRFACVAGSRELGHFLYRRES